jgi:Domain of unknown function (DUF1854)
MPSDFQLQRNSFGQLILIAANGNSYVDVEPARAFPINTPRENISIISSDGHELAWIEKLDELPSETRQLVEEALKAREFMPEIQRVTGVSGYATPCTWEVETDRGSTNLILNSEEDIRRLTFPALLIVDSRGIQFLIRDRGSLDKTSRKILDRFL